MEIRTQESYTANTNLFKIDLIVWKQNFLNALGIHSPGFKIDLIVWKLINGSTNPYSFMLV